MELHSDRPVMFFATQGQWEKWLATHYEEQRGLWLKFAKKASGITSINYAEALDVALCYGWIDGQTKSLDDTYYLQLFVPRRPKSMWSKRNIAKVESLIAAGKMQPPGFAQIEAAKRDGRWDQAYDSPRTITVPEDFQHALDTHPDAAAFFASLNSANRYAFLFRIQTAKKPETRQARIDAFIKMLINKEIFYP